jgi:hypothetical protein
VGLVKVQYFSFFRYRFDASEVDSELSPSCSEDWDYALKEENGVITAFIPSIAHNRWVTMEDGYNPWELQFLEPGLYGYEDYPEYLPLAK